jgi:hypothetical protein
MAEQKPNPEALTGDGLLNGPGDDWGPKLTPQQIAKYRDRMRDGNDPQIRICRFLYNGQALNIQTGELASRGSNVIYHQHYWRWDKETAKEIAKDLGEKVRVVWQKE